MLNSFNYSVFWAVFIISTPCYFIAMAAANPSLFLLLKDLKAANPYFYYSSSSSDLRSNYIVYLDCLMNMWSRDVLKNSLSSSTETIKLTLRSS